MLNYALELQLLYFCTTLYLFNVTDQVLTLSLERVADFLASLNLLVLYNLHLICITLKLYLKILNFKRILTWGSNNKVDVICWALYRCNSMWMDVVVYQ